MTTIILTATPDGYRATAIAPNGYYIRRNSTGPTASMAVAHARTGVCSMNAPYDRKWPVPAMGKTVSFEVAS